MHYPLPVNAAIGGTQLIQNLVLMPRWLREAPEPDLVTVWFGFNDWDAGTRGAAFQAGPEGNRVPALSPLVSDPNWTAAAGRADAAAHRSSCSFQESRAVACIVIADSTNRYNRRASSGL